VAASGSGDADCDKMSPGDKNTKIIELDREKGFQKNIQLSAKLQEGKRNHVPILGNLPLPNAPEKEGSVSFPPGQRPEKVRIETKAKRNRGGEYRLPYRNTGRGKNWKSVAKPRSVRFTYPPSGFQACFPCPS